MAKAPPSLDRPAGIDEVVRRVVEISTLPQVALRVIDVAKDPDSGAAELKAVVEGDPALGARILRMTNSAAYGVRCRVTNLHQAISFLGFDQVRNLAMTASVSELFKKDEKIGTYRRTDLWRHLVSVGICARLVAMRRELPDFEDAFLAGLLHDLGLILEDQLLHKQFRELMVQLPDDVPLCMAERRYLGFDHCALGAAVGDQWRFPAAVRATIQHHHDSTRYHGDFRSIVHSVEIANVVCTLKGISSVGKRLIKPPLHAFQAMGYTKDDILILARDLDDELERSESLFEL